MARCKYGKLKNPIGRRRCRKTPRKGARKGVRRSRRSPIKGKCCKRFMRTRLGRRCGSFGGC